MGGYGAIKIAMKHPDIFSTVYGTSSCCLAQSPTDFNQKIIDATLATKTWDDWKNAGFFTKAIIAQSAAYAPNPTNPPFFGDIPYPLKGDTTSVSEKAQAKWLANIPSWMADQYNSNLRQLKAISFDAGSHDAPDVLPYNQYFSQTLSKMKVQHTFEIFDGGHGDKVKERIETKILPFFSNALVSEN
jgi:S-formylglutathione hydrolase FrmB